MLLKITKRNILEFWSMVTATNSLRNTRMDNNDTESFSEDELIQESTYLAHAEIEDISPTFVAVTEFSNLTLNDQEHFNELAAIENISVNKTI